MTIIDKFRNIHKRLMQIWKVLSLCLATMALNMKKNQENRPRKDFASNILL